jgi:hypothetical protein
MSDFRDSEEKLKTTGADEVVSPADRMDAGMSTGSTSADASDENMGVLGDVAHPFDQTNGILDDFDETHPGNVTGESPSEYAASAGPLGGEASRPSGNSEADLVDEIDDDDTPVVPPPIPSAGR